MIPKSDEEFMNNTIQMISILTELKPLVKDPIVSEKIHDAFQIVLANVEYLLNRKT